MYVNNEIGTVQPIAEIARLIQNFKKELTDSRLRGNDRGEKGVRKTVEDGNDRRGTTSPLSAIRYPLLHCDASQAFQFFDCGVAAVHVDMMTLSSHKIYGPKGAAALYVKDPESRNQNPVKEKNRNKNLPDSGFWILDSVITGGGQEFGFRSGTENVPAIVGFAKAAGIAAATREKESKRIAALRDYFWRGVKKIYPKAVINGVPPVNVLRNTHSVPDCAPHILNVYFPGHDAQDILTRLDLAGIAASSGSACRTRAATSSYVIVALGYSMERARSSVRFSFGRPTTLREIDETLKIVQIILK
jgi:cysteine desulfurase